MMQAQVVVASRFHNLICALRVGRPTVSVGYASKNRHLMEAMGLDGYCQDIEHLDAGQLVEQLGAAQRYREALAARIRRGTLHYADEVKSLFEPVAREDLGLAAHKPRDIDVPSEVVRWRAT